MQQLDVSRNMDLDTWRPPLHAAHAIFSTAGEMAIRTPRSLYRIVFRAMTPASGVQIGQVVGATEHACTIRSVLKTYNIYNVHCLLSVAARNTHSKSTSPRGLILGKQRPKISENWYVMQHSFSPIPITCEHRPDDRI